MAGELDNQEIVLGAGEVYMYEFDGTAVPEDTVIETDAHNVGHCSGGFSIEYKPENYDVENQYGKTVKRYIIKEAITAKTGVLRWRRQSRLQRLPIWQRTTLWHPWRPVRGRWMVKTQWLIQRRPRPINWALRAGLSI